MFRFFSRKFGFLMLCMYVQIKNVCFFYTSEGNLVLVKGGQRSENISDPMKYIYSASVSRPESRTSLLILKLSNRYTLFPLLAVYTAGKIRIEALIHAMFLQSLLIILTLNNNNIK